MPITVYTNMIRYIYNVAILLLIGIKYEEEIVRTTIGYFSAHVVFVYQLRPKQAG